MVGGEWEKSDPVGCVTARDWCAKNTAFVNGPGGTAGPSFILSENARANQISNSGVFFNATPGATQTTQLNAAGNGVVPFTVGSGQTTSAFNNVVGGDGRQQYQYTNLTAPVDRKIGTATFEFALTDALNMNVDVSYGDVETTNRTGALDANFTFLSNAENPFITQTAAILAATGMSAWFVAEMGRNVAVEAAIAEMGRALDEPLPDAPLADGVRIAPWSLELDDATADAHNGAFLDHWGSEPNTPEEWRHHHRESPAFRGDLSRLALDGDRAVGYVIVHRYAEEDELQGKRVGWLQTIGVRRSHRRRGIASALIVATSTISPAITFTGSRRAVVVPSLVESSRRSESSAFISTDFSVVRKSPG